MSLDVTLQLNVKVDQNKRHTVVFFSDNYTHNCNRMADEAGIYECVWRPRENGMLWAQDVIEPLSKGIKLMKDQPEKFKALNPTNGWGSYETFLPWLEKYLEACERYPLAEVYTSI